MYYDTLCKNKCKNWGEEIKIVIKYKTNELILGESIFEKSEQRITLSIEFIIFPFKHV